MPAYNNVAATSFIDMILVSICFNAYIFLRLDCF